MTDTFTSIRSSYRGLDAMSSLEKPTSILLGVSQAAANALSDIGIFTVFDLASSKIFSNAVDICLLAESGEGPFADTGKVPRDILREGHGKPIRDLPLQPVSVLSTHSTKAQLDALAAAIDVVSIREFAVWPPYRIARELLNRAYNPLAAEALDQEAPADLIPANGRYPTERVQYEILLFDEFVGGSTTAASPLGEYGALDISVLLSEDGGYERPAIGGLLTFTQSWYTKALALGNLIHGVALAPGESTKIAMIDWARRIQASATEVIGEDEVLAADISRSRAISEITRAVARETQEGQSAAQSFSTSTQRGESSGAAGFRDLSLDPNVATNVVTSPGVTTSGTSFGTSTGFTFGTAWSTSSGQREVGASLSQDIVDRTHQAAHSARNRRASIVREVSQQESESISTRTLTNYNHMHALTVEYYEVVQLYRTVVELSKADRCLFVPMKLIDFRNVALIDRYRAVLAAAALSPIVVEAFVYPTGTIQVKAPAISTASLYTSPATPQSSGTSDVQTAINRYHLIIWNGNRVARGKIEVHLGLADGSWKMLDLKARKQDGGGEILENDGYEKLVLAGEAIGLDPTQIQHVRVNWYKADASDEYWLFRGIGIRYLTAKSSVEETLIHEYNDPYRAEFGDGAGQVKEWVRTIKSPAAHAPADQASADRWNAKDIHEAQAATAGVTRVLPDGRLVLPSDVVVHAVSFAAKDSAVKPGGLTIRKVDGTSITRAYGSSGWDMTSTRMRISDIVELTITASGVSSSGSVGIVSIMFEFKSRHFQIAIPVKLQPNGPSSLLYVATVPADVISHLQDNRLYYSQAIWRALDPATIGILLSGFTWPVGDNAKRLIELVDPAPAAIAANYLVLRLSGDDITEHANWLTKKKIVVGSRREDLVPVPSGGVFAEAVMGRFNAAEKLDITRFWNWQDSPIPIQAPDIAAIQAGSRRDQDTTVPGQLGTPQLNIVNPPSLPDPQGLGAVLAAIQNGNMFRDMSGLAATIGLAQAGLEGAQQGATAAAAQAGENAAVAAELGAKVAELAAKIIGAYLSGGGSLAGGSGVEGLAGLAGGISGQGAKIRHGQDMDKRGLPSPSSKLAGAGVGSAAGNNGSAGSGASSSPLTGNEGVAFEAALGNEPDGALGQLILERVLGQSTGSTTASVGSSASRDPSFETDWARAHPEGHVEMGVVNGKAQSDILVLWNFGVGSADIGKFTDQLARHIPMLKGWTDLGDQILIEGATSTSGSEKRNLTLGLARALAVKRWLVTVAKLPAAQILTETLGEGEQLPGLPVLEGEAAARNRRVEMRRIALNWEDMPTDNYQRALKIVTQSQLPAQQKKRLTGLLTHLRDPYADDLYFNKDAVLWLRQFLGRPGYEWLDSPSRWPHGEPPLLAHMRDRFATLHPRSSDTVVLAEMRSIDFLLLEGIDWINDVAARTEVAEGKLDILYEAIKNWIAAQQKNSKSLYYTYGTAP